MASNKIDQEASVFTFPVGLPAVGHGTITETLMRFPGVTKVMILVEGQRDQLQP